MNARHIPVLLNEVVDALQPRDGGRYVDGTFGAGGYTTAMLDRAQKGRFAYPAINCSSIETINAALEGFVRAAALELLPRGLVYSAGYGRFHKPVFFLGALARMDGPVDPAQIARLLREHGERRDPRGAEPRRRQRSHRFVLIQEALTQGSGHGHHVSPGPFMSIYWTLLPRAFSSAP